MKQILIADQTAQPLDITGAITRREAIRSLGLGGGGLLLGAGFTAPQCGGAKNLSTNVVIIMRSYGEIKELLPETGLSQSVIDRVSGYIAKAIKVAEDFDKAYRAGAFQNAATLFNQLGGLVGDIANDVGASNHRVVRVTLVGIQIARIAIAGLLAAQAANQPAVRTAKKSPEMVAAIAEIERLNALDIDRLLPNTR